MGLVRQAYLRSRTLKIGDIELNQPDSLFSVQGNWATIMVLGFASRKSSTSIVRDVQ